LRVTGSSPGTARRRKAARLGLALDRERRELLDDDGIARKAERRLTDQDLSRRRCLFQPCSKVDCVPGRETLARAGDDLSGRHADPPLNTESGKRVAHLDRGTNGSKRIVLVEDRHPKDGHDGITDELLDRAAVALDDRLHPLEVPGKQRPERLRVELLA
jgi:hypothetical protein